MGIRRRRKKVNTILSTIDRRLRSVELRTVPRVVKDGTITKRMLDKSVQIALDSGSDAATNNPGITKPQAPTFKTKPLTNIVKIVYTGYNEAGTANDRDRARVYFETDPGLNVGDKIQFASLTGSLDVPTKTTEYTVKEVGVVSGYNTIVYYPGRATIVDGSKTYDKGWRIRAANVSVTGAIVDGATTKYKYGQIILDGKGTSPTTNDDYLWGPTWPAGINTTSGTHFTGGGFNVGSLINIDGLGTLFDGTHRITYKDVTDKQITLQFEFKEYPTAPVTLPSSSGAVRGACGRYLRDGETWIDTTVEPAITWIWDDQRQLWWNAAETTLPEGVVVDDGVPPSSPTNLSGTAEGYVVGSSAYSRVNLSWTAPTTNSDGTNLSDLKGYAVYYRYYTTDAWEYYSDVVGSTSETISQLKPKKTVYFAVKAYDATRNMSSYSSSYSILTVEGATGINAPSIPVTTSRLGQIRVTWNGLDSSGATPPSDLIDYVEVHWSTTNDFTPDETTKKGRLEDKNDYFSDIDPEYDTNYYFKFIFVDIFGEKSAASAQKIATVTPLVDTDLIEGTLTRWPFGAGTIDPASLANGSISATYLADGAVIQSKVAAGAIGANEIAANSIVAGKLAANSVTSASIQALAITAGKIESNAITSDKIDAGAVTAIKIQGESITGDKISATTSFTLYDPSINKNIKMGFQNGGSYQDVAYGLYESSSLIGWLGAWGGGAIEIGTDFLNNYIDMYTDNTMNISSSGSGGVNFTSNASFNGTRLYSYGRIVGYSGSDTAALIVYDGYGGTEVFRVNTSTATVKVTGNIQYTGTITDVSSERFKTDISPYETNYSILDIPLVNYRYDFSKIDPSRRDISDVLLGTIAERAVEVGAGDIVTYDDGGSPYGVDYTLIGLMLIPIVKELREEIQILKDRIN